jgi:hypothetical protein
MTQSLNRLKSIANSSYDYSGQVAYELQPYFVDTWFPLNLDVGQRTNTYQAFFIIQKLSAVRKIIFHLKLKTYSREEDRDEYNMKTMNTNNPMTPGRHSSPRKSFRSRENVNLQYKAATGTPTYGDQLTPPDRALIRNHTSAGGFTVHLNEVESNLKYAQQTDDDYYDEYLHDPIISALNSKYSGKITTSLFCNKFAPLIRRIPNLPQKRSSVHSMLEVSIQPVNIKSYFRSRLGKPDLIMHSKLIHYGLNFKNLSWTTIIFSTVYVLLIISTLIVYFMERSVIKKFMGVTTDVAILDAHEYLLWSVHRQMLDINVGRMVKNGLIEQDSYSEYGIGKNISKHLKELFESEGYIGEMPVSFLRLMRKYELTNFPQYHDPAVLSREVIPINDIKEDGLMVKITYYRPFDALRLVQSRFDSFALEEGIDKYKSIGSSRWESPREEFARYNCLNPLTNYFEIGTSCLIT